MTASRRIEYDYTRLFASVIGATGVAREALDSDTLGANHAALHARIDAGEAPFLRLHEDTRLVGRINAFAETARSLFNDCVVLGIGGSSLGGRALVAALGGRGMRVHFPDNLDPDAFGRLLNGLDLERTLFNCISKSGSTVETLAQLLVVRARLKDRLGAHWSKHLVVTTDPKNGFLRRLADSDGLTRFEIPPGVGGRYSVLTPVGLLPAALAGVNISALMAGAASAAAILASGDWLHNPALATAALLQRLDTHHGRSVLFVVPYANALAPLAEWFQQLWAESLGKDGKGSTPVPVVGATCQHSQLQLWMEGPPNAVVAFIDVERFDNDIPIPLGDLASQTELDSLQGHTMGHVLRTERQATEQALTDSGRPNMTWRMPSITPESVAALMVEMMAMTAYAGGLYGVDPFNQPGVEAGKLITKQLLKK